MYENMKNKDCPSELISTYFKQVYTASSENPVVVILWQLLSKEVVCMYLLLSSDRACKRK